MLIPHSATPCGPLGWTRLVQKLGTIRLLNPEPLEEMSNIGMHCLLKLQVEALCITCHVLSFVPL